MSSFKSIVAYNYFILKVVSEITMAVGGVQIEEPEIDYLAFQTRLEIHTGRRDKSEISYRYHICYFVISSWH
jgi:hypothetical protein